MLDKLEQKYGELFDPTLTSSYFSPGRVNLIGEHTDYNGGFVFPCALSFGTYAIVGKRKDKEMRMYSTNFEDKGVIIFDIDKLENDPSHFWANYLKGVIKIFENHGYKMTHGLNIVLGGEIPSNAGLSSSACVEVLMGTILNDIFSFGIEGTSMAKMCQEAENKFIGVNCGIMDQFIIANGKKDCAILLDCNTLNYTYVPLTLEHYKIVISNTSKPRNLITSKYNERRSECEHALAQLQTKLKINALGNLSEKVFEENKYLITNAIEQKRAKHAVYENQRTLKAVEALKNKDLVLLGKLMNESHISLRDDYEVTGKELDTLVALAWKQEGVLGSRMTGAGFGGCTVSIVHENKVNDFIKNVGNQYKEQIGYEAVFYIASVGNGAMKI
ncbi:MAG: galactokinase [Anaerovoracaceae bacterium]